jgi:hypothetical protein
VSKIDQLVDRYEQQVALPWKSRLAGSQKVWFIVYPPDYERRLRTRFEEFKLATARADKTWLRCDLTRAFPEWMAGHEYREDYFATPEALAFELEEDFTQYVADQARATLESEDADEESVVALTGLSTLFGLTRVSAVVRRLESVITGRLAVFFPGRHAQNTYRFLDARDGRDYLATPVKLQG